MKKTWLIWTGWFLLLFVLASCATGKDEQGKKEGAAYRRVGEAYMQQGNIAAAMQEFKKAEEKYPDDYLLQYDLGLIYYSRGRFDEAIGHYQKAVGLKGELERSEKYYLEALQIKPEFVNALQGLAQTYIAMGRIPEAVEKLEKAVRIMPDSPALHLQLAKAYQQALEFQKAYNSYRKVVDLAPESLMADEAQKAAGKVKTLF